MIIHFSKYIIIVIFTTILLSIGQLSSYGFVPLKNDSIRFEVLLSSKMLNDLHLEVNFVESQEITSNRLILLSSANQFYLLGWGGIKPLGSKMADTIRSFAYTPDGFLMIVRNRELCYIDSIGKMVKLLGLPGSGMGFNAGGKALYLYDQKNIKKKYALYILEQGGKYKELLTVPAPIRSVAEINQSILFSSENILFSFNAGNKEIKVLATLTKEKEIKSIAVDSSSNTIYFSTNNSIYAVIDSKTINLTNEFGGILRCFNEGLLVFNPEKKFLIRIVGLEDKITSKFQELKTVQPAKLQDNILTNATIIDMVKQKLSDGIIINMINRSTVNFNLSIDSMIYLSSQNVSSAIIMAMKNAMNSKISKESNKTNH